MSEKPIKVPGPDHPIAIDRNAGRVTVKVGGKVIAATDRALRLKEASYPAVQYIPREDVDMAALGASPSRTYCPYKGDASYFRALDAEGRGADVAWSYESPHDAVEPIRGYLAFYPNRVDAIEVEG